MATGRGGGYTAPAAVIECEMGPVRPVVTAEEEALRVGDKLSGVLQDAEIKMEFRASGETRLKKRLTLITSVSGDDSDGACICPNNLSWFHNLKKWRF